MSQSEEEAPKQASPEQTASTEVVKAESGVIEDGRQRDLGFPAELRELIGVERERIESANRRTEVARYAIEMNDASDRRQYDFQIAQLTAQGDDGKRRYKFGVGVSVAGFVVFVSLSGLLLWMVFWGTDHQSEMSLTIMKSLGVGVAGYGVIGSVTRAFKTLMNHVGKS